MAALRCKNVVIERIVSADRPDPMVYDPVQDEWVRLLEGSAKLEVEDREVTLSAGDTLFIPAHTPHRVLEASKNPPYSGLAGHNH